MDYRTTILGHKVSAPFFISPCSRGAYGNPADKEKGLIEGAAAEGILYMVRTAPALLSHRCEGHNVPSDFSFFFRLKPNISAAACLAPDLHLLSQTDMLGTARGRYSRDPHPPMRP